MKVLRRCPFAIAQRRTEHVLLVCTLTNHDTDLRSATTRVRLRAGIVTELTLRNRTCQSQRKRHISVTSQSCPIVYQSVYDWREATLIATCSQTAESAQEMSAIDGLSLNKPCDYSGRARKD